jgi:hypothetical protein
MTLFWSERVDLNHQQPSSKDDRLPIDPTLRLNIAGSVPAVPQAVERREITAKEPGYIKADAFLSLYLD